MITLAHGGGGRAANELIRKEILPRFGNGPLAGLPDGATLPGGWVFSTDSFVVSPCFFPGGDIGKLAVCGTVNDVLMAGGIPQFLSLAMILEEGFPREHLSRILDSVRETAADCGISIATGDTKVVPRGGADGIYLNTAGLGAPGRFRLGRERIAPNDVVLLSGTAGDHGMAILGARHGMHGLRSDCGMLHKWVEALPDEGVKFMRDPTRGGVGGVLAEIVEDTLFDIELDDAAFPIAPETAAAAALLGVDPLFSACEGRMLAVVAPECAGVILEKWKMLHPAACAIGIVRTGTGRVTRRGEWGALRLLIQPEGDPVPRIC